MYDVVVRFSSKEIAEKFMMQMSDGFGEGFCDFSVWNKTEINGKNEYSKLCVSEVETDTPVCFVNKIYEF